MIKVDDFIKKESKTIGIFSLGIIFIFLFFKYIVDLFLYVGDFIHPRIITFQIGYFLGATLIVSIYVRLIFIQFIHGKYFNLLIFYIGIVYILIRFIFSQYIEFESIYSFLKYSDLILVMLALHITNLLSVFFKSQMIKNRDSENSYFVNDNLFDGEELDNQKILKKLIDVLLGFKPDVAFSIGLNAIWGYGKSSFLLKFKELYSKENPKAIIFWNRIWKNKGSNAIIEIFFEELKYQLKPYSADISDDVNSYVDAILNISDNDLNKFLINGRTLISENYTLENYYNNINSIIKRIDRQVIVLLDDLDRLEKSEIMNTLKLIRTLSDFNNVIFIAGYDRKYVIDTMDVSKDKFIDKIFNVEINLLPFDEQLIIEELLKEVEIAFPSKTQEDDKQGFNAGFKNIFNYKSLDLDDYDDGDDFRNSISETNHINIEYSDYTLKYQDFIKTYRDVKRFINEFKFNASFLASERDVVAEEYILLKLLTYKHRGLQNIVFNRLKYLFKSIDDDDQSNNFNTNSKISGEIYKYNRYVKKRIFKELLKNKFSREDIVVINAVLIKLFGEKSVGFYKKNQNTISKVYYSDIYVKNNIGIGQITLTEIQYSFANNKLYEYAKNLTSSTKDISFSERIEIRQFIFNNHQTNKHRFVDCLRTLNFILINGNYNDDQKVINLIRSAYISLYEKDKQKLILDIQKIINNFSDDYFIYLIGEINLNSKRLKSGLNYFNLKRFENNEFTDEDLKNILIKHLKYLVDLSHSPDELHERYALCIESIVGDKKILFSKDGNVLMRKDIESRLVEYMQSNVFSTLVNPISESYGESYGYSPHFTLAQIFSNSSTLKKLIENPRNEDLYNLFYEEGWNNFSYFLNNHRFSGEQISTIGKEKIENMKKFLNAYCENNYSSLTKEKYYEIWNELPF